MLKKVLATVCVCLFLSPPVFAINWQTGFDSGKLDASQVNVDCTNFSMNLSCADTNVQHALNTLDQLSAGGGGGSVNWSAPANIIYTGWTHSGTNEFLTTSTDNVGVGTFNPLAKFQTHVATNQNLAINSGATGARLESFNDAMLMDAPMEVQGTNISMVTNPGNVLIPNGNVGINAPTPSGKLIVLGGNVGIGVNSPAADTGASRVLDITGTTDVGLVLHSTTSPQGWNFYVAGGAAYQSIGGAASAASNLYLWNAAQSNSSYSMTELMRLQNNGNLGIGSTAPGTKLDVAGKTRTQTFQLTTTPTNNYVLTSDASGNGTWQPASGGTGSNYWNLSAGNVGINTSNNVGIGTTLTTTSALTVMSGNVGIGTWVPSVTLNVLGREIVQSLVDTDGSGGNAPFKVLDKNGTTEMYVRQDGALYTGYISTLDNATAGFAQVSPGSGLPGLALNPTAAVAWTGSGNWYTTPDVTLSRVSSGVLGVGTNAIGSANGALVTGNIGIGTSLTTTSALTVMNGNVGIGTWKPGAALQVNGTSSKYRAQSADGTFWNCQPANTTGVFTCS